VETTKAETFACQYCEKEFKREKTLFTHICEQKRRYNSKSDSNVQLGLYAFNTFYKASQNRLKEKSFDDFAKSPYYTAFVKFGKYCNEVKAISPIRFIDYVIRNNKRLDDWATDKMYTEYLAYIIVKEDVGDALTRGIEYSFEWAEEHDMEACDLLRYGSETRICYAINAGKISPWAIYQSKSGEAFLNQLPNKQIQMIWDMIDADVWSKKFNKSPDDVKFAQTILKDAGW